MACKTNKIGDSLLNSLIKEYGQEEGLRTFIQHETGSVDAYKKLNDRYLGDRTEAIAEEFEEDMFSLSSDETNAIMDDELNSEELVSEDADLTETIMNSALRELNNRIRSLKKIAGKDPEKEELRRQKIQELEESYEEVEREKLIQDVLNVLETNINDLKVDTIGSDVLYTSDLLDGFSELTSWANVLNNILQYDSIDKKTSTPIHKLKDAASIEQAERLRKEVVNNLNILMKLTEQQLINKAKEDKGVMLGVEDLRLMKDTNAVSAAVLDLSKIDNQMVKLIDSYLKDSNRNAMNEFVEKLDDPLTGHLERLLAQGIDMTTQKDADRFLQEDENGKKKGNLITRFSDKWYKVEEGIRNRINSIEKYRKNQDSETNARNTGQLIKKIAATHVIANPVKLFGVLANDTSIQEETERLVKEVGVSAASEMIAKGRKKWERWETSREAVFNKYRNNFETGQEGFETEEMMLQKVQTWELFNSPEQTFNSISGIGDKTQTLQGYKYLGVAPIKTTAKGTKTAFYDSKFEAVQSNPELKALYDFMMSSLSEYKSWLPPYISDKLQENYLPEVHKTLMEGLMEGDYKGASFFEKVKTLTMKGIDSFWGSVSATDEGITEFSIRDENNKAVKSVPIKYAYDVLGGLRNRIAQLKSRETALTSLIEIKALRNRARPDKKTSDFITEKRIELAEVKEQLELAESKLVEKEGNKSHDVMKAFKMFGMMAINYKRKSKAEDIVLLGKKAMYEAEELITNAKGEGKVDKEGTLMSYKNGILNTKKSLDYAIDAIIYGEHKGTEGVTDVKVGLTKEARAELKDVKGQMREVQEKYLKGKMTLGERDNQMDDLETKLAEISGVRNLTFSRVIDSLLKYTYLKGIGWNAISALSNVMLGKIANSVEAASGQFFNLRAYKRAEGVMMHSSKKSLTTKEDRVARKTNLLIKKFGILFDVNESSYGNNKGTSDKMKKLGFLLPMEMQKRGEYANQGVTMLSVLMTKTIKNKDGKEVSLYDAYDDMGRLDSEMYPTAGEYASLVEGNESNEFTKLRNSIIQVNKRLHGNYDPSSPLMAKKTALGRAAVTFKTWLFEGVSTRFEKEYMDDQLGEKVKGRYRSYGTIVSQLGFIGSIKATTDILMNNMLKNKDAKYPNIDPIDVQNMRRNLMEIAWGLTTISMFLLAKALLDDDDKDEAKGLRLTLNFISRMQSDLVLYMNPVEFGKLTQNPFPLIGSLKAIAAIPSSIWRATTEDNSRYDGEYVFRSILKAFPGTAQPVRIVETATGN